jgi:hypothetical protein
LQNNAKGCGTLLNCTEEKLDYIGGFSVILTDKAENFFQRLDGAVFQNNIIEVDSGRVSQSMGGIQLYAKDVPFYLGYTFIKEIRDNNDRIIWPKYNYKKP